jgi:hypothetical protein
MARFVLDQDGDLAFEYVEALILRRRSSPS